MALTVDGEGGILHHDILRFFAAILNRAHDTEEGMSLVKTLEEVTGMLRTNRPILEKEYGVNRLAVFGSYARAEQTDRSDVDIIVEFRVTPGLRFVHLANFLEALLGLRVDLVTLDAIKPNRRNHIMKDLVYV